jgi:hypothetical protein
MQLFVNFIFLFNDVRLVASMSENVVKKKYLKKIIKALMTVNVYFDVYDFDLDEFTEESLFLDYWDVQQMCICSGQHTTNQLYKLWRNRVENMQPVQEEPIIDEEFS